MMGTMKINASDPLLGARERGADSRQQLLEAAGGGLSAEQAARLLGMSRQAVDNMRKAGGLLALELGRRGNLYPAFQFTASGLLPGLTETLAALRSHDVWMMLAFFVSPNLRLNGKAPVERLQSGDVSAVVAAAVAFGEHGAA